MKEPLENLPEAVKKQRAEAEEAQKKLADQEGQETPPKAEDQPPKKPDESSPEPTDVDKKEKDKGPVDWEQRYNVLKGKYDAEITADVNSLQERVSNLDTENARLRGQVADAAATVQTLNGLIANLQASDGGGEAGTPADPDTDSLRGPFEDLDPDDFEGYGNEMSGENGLIAKFNAQNRMIANLLNRLDNTEKKTAKTEMEQFWIDLARIVPDCRDINNDPAFIEWLNEEDPTTGLVRMGVLQGHFAKFDVNRCSKFFKAFKANGHRGDNAPRKRQDDDALRGEIMPEGTGGGELNLEEDANAPTPQEMQKAADDFARKKITLEEFTKKSRAFQRSLTRTGMGQ